MSTRCAKPWCEWWIASAHKLTVSALSTSWRDHSQLAMRSRIRDHRHCESRNGIVAQNILFNIVI